MKVCGVCNKSKPLDLFGMNKSKKDGHQSNCKECRKAINHAHYEKTKHRWAESRRLSSIQGRKRNQEFLEGYLLDNPCVDCGERDIRVLDFDHVIGEKVREVTLLIDSALEKMIEEINKCEVRCANCHRKMTHERMGLTSWRQRSYQRTLSVK